MKKLLLFFLASIAIIACDEKKENSAATEQAIEYEISDSTVYGRCADAARFTLLLATPNGDTIEYIIPDDCNEDDRIVLGGIFNNDKMAVTSVKNEDDENVATRIINISTLLGEWSNETDDITLTEGSSEWKILNGQLVVKQDTFNIYDLGPDTLVLENNTGIYNYRRQDK